MSYLYACTNDFIDFNEAPTSSNNLAPAGSTQKLVADRDDYAEVYQLTSNIEINGSNYSHISIQTNGFIQFFNSAVTSKTYGALSDANAGATTISVGYRPNLDSVKNSVSISLPWADYWTQTRTGSSFYYYLGTTETVLYYNTAMYGGNSNINNFMNIKLTIYQDVSNTLNTLNTPNRNGDIKIEFGNTKGLDIHNGIWGSTPPIFGISYGNGSNPNEIALNTLKAGSQLAGFTQNVNKDDIKNSMIYLKNSNTNLLDLIKYEISYFMDGVTDSSNLKATLSATAPDAATFYPMLARALNSINIVNTILKQESTPIYGNNLNDSKILNCEIILEKLF